MVPGAQPAAGASNSRLGTTSAPSQRIADIESRKKAAAVVTFKDPLANWVYLEPLAVTDQAAFSVPPWVKKCSSLNPVFGGLWYISFANFSNPLGQMTLPSCTLPANAVASYGLTRSHSDAIIPAGNGNIYILEIDVGFISLTTTPVAGPALGTGPTWLFGPLEPSLNIQQDHLYAFFLAEYTGTGTPTTVSI